MKWRTVSFLIDQPCMDCSTIYALQVVAKLKELFEYKQNQIWICLLGCHQSQFMFLMNPNSFQKLKQYTYKWPITFD